MISTRLAAGVAAAVLVVGILVGSATAVLLARNGDRAIGLWAQMRTGYPAMMDGSWGMMGGRDRGDMLDMMREHMGYGTDAP